jgi:predicted nucleotidyltransferase
MPLFKGDEKSAAMVKNSREVRRIVKNLVSGLGKRGIKVNRLILYGSYAQGKARPESDIDIAVISETFNHKGLLKRQELLGEAIFGLKEPVEAIGYSHKEFQKRHPLSFLSDIVAEGKVVYKA